LIEVKRRLLLNEAFNIINTVMETATEYKYIVKRGDTGEPKIANTRLYVRDIVAQWKLGHKAEEVLQCYPHVTLAQVFEALAYYQDHMDEIENFFALNSLPESVRDTPVSR
jgi:uncharacterized protein (DUF433 family)